MADQWLVDDGLAEGDRVIVEGVQKAEPGGVVKALERTAEPGASAGVNASRPLDGAKGEAGHAGLDKAALATADAASTSPANANAPNSALAKAAISTIDLASTDPAKR
jgi:membrane fusion protein (multidrug efflux system)